MRTLSITEADAVAGGVAGGYGWKVVYQAGGHTLSGDYTVGSCRNEVNSVSDCKGDVHAAVSTGGAFGGVIGAAVGGPWGAFPGIAVGMLVGLHLGLTQSSGCKPKRYNNL
ncbi:MAG: hypothetical protein K1X48_03100 [Burkholderiaceae bacterium]|nr:hypothetical protein [Burkholderiaceae bacterium]